MKTRFFALATLVLALAACNNDNENLNGDPVAAQFTADIALATRASGTTGDNGDRIGITAGYQLRLNKALDLDFNLGLGYLNADFEKYEVIDGVRVRCGNETKNWCGPINAGVTLVWKLF